MTTKAAFQFLKPLLGQFTPEEKEELCRMIANNSEKVPKKRKGRYDHIPSVADYKRMLINTYFK